MRDNVSIKLKYTGSDVNDGTMSVEDMVPALQGFASAYGKIVNSDELQVRHKLRVVGVGKGSFHILLEVIVDAAQKIMENKELIGGVTFSGTLGYVVIKKIIGVIQIQKHTKNQAFTTTVNGNKGTVNVVNIDKVSLEIPHEIFKIYSEKTLKPDINKIVKPLEEGKIDSTEIVLEKGDGEVVSEKINVSEKSYFDVESIPVTKTELTTLTGFFLSLYKSTNKGYFILNDGNRVTYQLSGDRPERLWPLVIHKGAVRIKCIVHIDENLKPSLLDVSDVEIIQKSLFSVSERSENNM